MPVADILFDKFEANRREIKGRILDVKVANNSTISKTEKKEIDGLGETIVVHFEVTSKYAPDIGDIKLTGRVLYKTNDMDQTLKEEKGKLVFKDMRALEEVQNAILRVSSVESLILSKEIRLPPPLQLPFVTITDTKPLSDNEKRGYA